MGVLISTQDIDPHQADTPYTAARYKVREWDRNQAKYVLKHERPEGISKKAWKKLVRKLSPGLTEVPSIVGAKDVDQYGFTQAERSYLANNGWGIETIDAFVELKVTAAEMLKLAQLDIWPVDVQAAYDDGWTMAGILKSWDDTMLEIEHKPEKKEEAVNGNTE